MASRKSTHVTETRSRTKFAAMIANYRNGDALFREITERDYGIDGLLELFNDGIPTGKFALIQLKGSASTIVPLKTEPFVSVGGVSASNIQYAFQTNIPVIIVYISLKTGSSYYYADMHTIVSEDILETAQNNESGKTTLRIPVGNCALDNIEPLVEIINNYYERRQSN
ncbi:DUF4365 domain-containing protein [Ruminococcus flavefaciens]|uniref:DUF4365 domain-containing protein n=1 Tax=Ruminococcus flavefaciens TaxID=1265 RepID=UPI00048CBAC2|nr:DUF4365 domain-containing protein [Ruminococcus flavefaciens]